jgi:hypothetical protein
MMFSSSILAQRTATFGVWGGLSPLQAGMPAKDDFQLEIYLYWNMVWTIQWKNKQG